MIEITKSIGWSVGAVLLGIIIGYKFCTDTAKAYDPCDTSYNWEKPPSNSYEPYKPDDDAAMQFYWQDHKPSLHAR